MTPEEVQAQQAEILAGQRQARVQQKSEGGIEDVVDLALDVVDAVTNPGDIFGLVAGGVRATAAGAVELASGALDLAGSATSGAVDVAGDAASAVLEGAAAAVGAVAEVVAGLFD